MILAMRDATAARRPGRAARYHVKVDEIGTLMGPFDKDKIIDPGYGFAACDRGMSLVETTEVPPEKVPAILLCRRAGCQMHFERYLNHCEGYE